MSDLGSASGGHSNGGVGARGRNLEFSERFSPGDPRRSRSVVELVVHNASLRQRIHKRSVAKDLGIAKYGLRKVE